MTASPKIFRRRVAGARAVVLTPLLISLLSQNCLGVASVDVSARVHRNRVGGVRRSRQMHSNPATSLDRKVQVIEADHIDEHDGEHQDEETSADLDLLHDDEHDGDEKAAAGQHADQHDAGEEEEGDADDHDEGHTEEGGELATEFGTFEAHNSSANKPWGAVILATFLVNIAALAGIIVLIPTVLRSKFCCFKKKEGDTDSPKKKDEGRLIDIAIPSFAAGALLAASVFLILPEAYLLLQRGDASMVNTASEEEGEHHDDEHHDDEHRRRAQEEHDGHEGHEDEVEGLAWKMGCAILGGFLLPMVLGAMFPRALEHECDDECGEAPDLRDSSANLALLNTPIRDEPGHCCACEVEATKEDIATDIATKSAMSNCSSCCEKGKDCEEPDDCIALDHDHSHDHGHDHGHDETQTGFKDEERAAPQSQCNHRTSKSTRTIRRNVNYRLCASILLGDGFHNFADGIFIGIGFLLCSRQVALSILFITLYHEIAQELADFFLLTKHGGLSVIWALVLNFCSGLFVMLGGITVLAVQDLTAQAVGIILGVAAGVYIHIAGSECIPRVDSFLHGWKDRLLAILMLVVGTVPIGLALLNHQHCDGH